MFQENCSVKLQALLNITFTDNSERGDKHVKRSAWVVKANMFKMGKLVIRTRAIAKSPCPLVPLFGTLRYLRPCSLSLSILVTDLFLIASYHALQKLFDSMPFDQVFANGTTTYTVFGTTCAVAKHRASLWSQSYGSQVFCFLVNLLLLLPLFHRFGRHFSRLAYQRVMHRWNGNYRNGIHETKSALHRLKGIRYLCLPLSNKCNVWRAKSRSYWAMSQSFRDKDAIRTKH